MNEPFLSLGLEGVIAGETAVGAVDQDTLIYRGYAIGDLAATCSFEEVAHLLIYDELPNKSQLESFKLNLVGYHALPDAVIQVIRLIPPEAPMMEVLRTTISILGNYSPFKAGHEPVEMCRRATWLTAAVGAIISARYRLARNLEPIPAKAGLSHASQILYQCHGKDPDATSARLLDLTLILYAEHEFNASTFTARVIASTLSDMISAVVGGIGALKGPLHGGANEEAMAMLKQFKNAAEASAWVKDALANKGKIMGFGHRVYKHGDHRARILEAEMRKLAAEKGQMNWVEIYDAIKNAMVNKEKPIYPNVDYPCGLTYHLMDLPLDLYTPLFVAARITGWCAHYMEQVTHNRIYRPLSRYTGPSARKVVPLAQRS